MFEFNLHSSQRAAQRNVGEQDIDYVVRYGQRFHRAGAVFYFLRQCDIPANDQALDTVARLAGTAVVLSKDESTLITIWRNRRSGLKHIRQKPLRGWAKDDPVL